jgi:hypothetical protein
VIRTPADYRLRAIVLRTSITVCGVIWLAVGAWLLG